MKRKADLGRPNSALEMPREMPISSHPREPQIQTCSIRGASHETGAPEAMADETPCGHVGSGISAGQGIPWVICLSE